MVPSDCRNPNRRKHTCVLACPKRRWYVSYTTEHAVSVRYRPVRLQLEVSVITFLTTAKPFVDATGIRQMNALRSWRAVAPSGEILLFGNGQGYDRAVSELGAIHIPDVACSGQGIPRLDGMFEAAVLRGRNAIKVYLNCDIILTSSVIKATQQIQLDRFLMVAQRWNMDYSTPIDFGHPTWETELAHRVRQDGQLFRAVAVDAFFWKGDIWQGLPPMVVGRAKYDQWLIYYCRSKKVPVVDATDVAMIIHQNHDYSHVQGGVKEVMEGEEVARNLSLAGGLDHMFTIGDADWRLTEKAMIRNHCRGDARRCADVFAVLHPETKWAQTAAGRFLVEAAYELALRVNALSRGELLPFLKYLPWLALRLCTPPGEKNSQP